MTLALGLILGWLLLTTVIGVLASRHRAFSMEEYFVAGRSFGMLLFYTTAAAEIYSAFAFLGLAGWAFGKGISIVYALAYGSMAYALFFFLGPRIHRLGRAFGYVTQPDFLADRYGSPLLGVAAAAIGVIFILPYLQLQIMGAGMIVQLASNGAMGWHTAVLVAFGAAVVFVFLSGLRGIGWTNLLQAVVMLCGMVAVGILFPSRFFGGLRPMFERLAEVSPAHLALPDTAGLGLSWYTSTALLSGLGLWVWPHVFAATYSARSERIVRRNAAILPLYQLAMVPVIVVGFTCAARAAGDPAFAERIGNPDHALLVALVGYFPPWVAGAIGAGGLAAAISTSSALILTAANLTARNVVQRGLRPEWSDDRTARFARALVPAVTAFAVALAFLAPGMLVDLLLTGYSGISQFFPAVVFGLFCRWPTRAAVLSGLGAGIATVALCHLAGISLPFGLHPGFVALLINAALVVTLSAVTRRVDPDRLARFENVLGT